ncbi:MAG: hypothetical protein LPK23_16480, partial [Rhodococcus sp. (in: high G+C Gram-positive bacteria)]|nr:hypothetical protein [Rhodococcus sp. (in: high G+C Gram-positive bacteria)]MDX5455899.1 hypothetical protein [Rhodococcus sp. (in: high G+C Gram-positive bacteria)]
AALMIAGILIPERDADHDVEVGLPDDAHGTMDALRMYDLPAIMMGSNPATSTISVLVVDQMRQGANSASALSTITFLIIFAVAFVLVRFLGANAVRTQEEQRKGTPA